MLLIAFYHETGSIFSHKQECCDGHLSVCLFDLFAIFSEQRGSGAAAPCPDSGCFVRLTGQE